MTKNAFKLILEHALFFRVKTKLCVDGTYM